MLLFSWAAMITALLRLITGTLEIIFAIIIWQSGKAKTVVKLSALMGVLGPLALLIGLALGLRELQEVEPIRIICLLLGALLLIIGSFI